MAKTVQGQNTSGENKRRLQEIAETRFGVLSDDEILRFLAQRKQLSDLEREYEKVQKEEEFRLEQERRKEESLKATEKKKIAILEKIKELNKSISGEVSDDDLLILVSHRRELEKELEELGGGATPQKEKVSPRPVSPSRVGENTLPEKESPKTAVPNARKEAAPGDGEKRASTEGSLQKLAGHVEEGYGSEKILSNGTQEDSQFHRYLDQLKNNVGSLGTLLQDMPLDAKKNKAFMLKVAEIDPAYAMHFADKDALKKDESFNIQVVSLKNQRNSGNALAEMLPEARTSKVLLAAVKQDYRNVRFIQPNMADYEEMINIAKTGALEKVRSLKEAVDMRLLIPKLLGQDKQFMLQVKEMTDPKKEE
ncbi:MAG: hypothetical protein Q7S04_02225 [Candidatus Moranbacteria bacterium]|nr:hypothetical protein [Candidatus Moranbacteria bacterium]